VSSIPPSIVSFSEGIVGCVVGAVVGLVVGAVVGAVVAAVVGIVVGAVVGSVVFFLQPVKTAVVRTKAKMMINERFILIPPLSYLLRR